MGNKNLGINSLDSQNLGIESDSFNKNDKIDGFRMVGMVEVRLMVAVPLAATSSQPALQELEGVIRDQGWDLTDSDVLEVGDTWVEVVYD